MKVSSDNDGESSDCFGAVGATGDSGHSSSQKPNW